jgi:hypothetical protein
MSVSLGRYFNLKVIQSGDRIEVYKYSKANAKGFEGKNRTGRKGKKDGMTNTEKNRREVLNRARNNIIRLVNCNPDLMTFISLTYKENMQDLQLSKAHLNRLFKELQRDFTEFKYLYVLELQGRGAIHYHMLCNLPVPVETAKSNFLKPEGQKILERQFHETYWGYGWVDIRDLSQEGNTNAGLYVSVYLVEDLFNLDLKGSKCYGYSRNLSRPKEYTELTAKKPYEVAASFDGYDIKYASNYNLQYEADKEVIRSQVNYFDMYRSEKDSR